MSFLPNLSLSILHVHLPQSKCVIYLVIFLENPEIFKEKGNRLLRRTCEKPSAIQTLERIVMFSETP
jgi:hypothetical protein